MIEMLASRGATNLIMVTSCLCNLSVFMLNLNGCRGVRQRMSLEI